MRQGLAGLRVLDFSTQIAGPYCSKLLTDAGAEVIKVEAPSGDSLRHQTADPAQDLGGEDSALFTFLNAGKRSVVGRSTDAAIQKLIGEADLVIEAYGLETDAGEKLDVGALRRAHPSLVVLSITPYGTQGPWAGRQATEFTIQAESGSIGVRGLVGGEPFQAGGRISEWVSGTFAGVSVLPALWNAIATGEGEHIDLSLLEVSNLVSTNYSDTLYRLMNGNPEEVPEPPFPGQSVETPSIEPTADGFVGFCTNTRQQFSDFLLMIERPDLRDDEELAQIPGRIMRFQEWNQIMADWLTKKTTAEVIEMASLLRIPVAPILNGKTVQDHEQLKARGVFGPDAQNRFLQPRRPYRVDDADPPAPRPAPSLDADGENPSFASKGAPREIGRPGKLPLEGLRVLDMTAWWAGPSASHLLATFGAEVIHAESVTRPDGMRMVGGMMAAHYSDWWEASCFFLHANSNKLGITLDLTKEKGRALIEKLVRECDLVVENFTPRVLENFGLTWERVQELNPKALMVRMPAFGLSGPWRDNTGFAQTMEQLSGMAWVTGHVDDQPRIPRGPCDPLAGMHATFACMVGLAERAVTGQGHHIESTMVEGALNIASEQILEWTAYGRLLEREGNRSRSAAPQGLYPCADGQPGMEKWLALSVATDAQWTRLVDVLGNPSWAEDPAFATLAGRREHHDAIDEHLRAWTRESDRAALVARLRAAEIPASEVADPRMLHGSNPQLEARGYYESPEHPALGVVAMPSLPFRYAGVERWLRTPAPTLGQHNDYVLGELLGLSKSEIEELEKDGLIGTRPEGL